jgi:ABC-type lipoprotein export system ATPase subunit
MNQPVIVAREVYKAYRTGEVEVKALNGLDLTIEKGEMIAIMGPSGCGKSTLLNCLSGLDSFDSGEILIEGTLLNRMSDARRTQYRAQRMGFIFQSYNLLPVLSAVENVELPLLISGMKTPEARQQSINVLEQVGLGRWIHHRPMQMSGGQRQRVTIARALANQPAIIWADEPTGALDSETTHEIMELMRDLNRQHAQTFVIVTHDPKIGQLCDRIVNMKDGKVQDYGIAMPAPVRKPHFANV